MNQPKPDLVLASASPRRRQLLQQMGVLFTVTSADIDETRQVDEPVVEFVQRLACEKAQAVANDVGDSTAVLAADTIVVQDAQVFGKPRDRTDAFRIWHSLSHASHQVITAVCLSYAGSVTVQVVATQVELDLITESQMQAYWDSGEPTDKAGGYAIQGLASAWVKLVHGSYSNVVGLPLREVNIMLKPIGLNWL